MLMSNCQKSMTPPQNNFSLLNIVTISFDVFVSLVLLFDSKTDTNGTRVVNNRIITNNMIALLISALLDFVIFI